MSESLEQIKNAILSLKAAGPDGFEGFVRIILTSLTGVPFRLAASGLQGGIDGSATFYSDSVCFEAKRYSDAIPRNEILSKVADLARSSHASDRLWVLGATSEVSSQLVSAVREVGNQRAISTLILDWAEFPLPLLGITAVAAGQQAIDFLYEYGAPECERDTLDEAFKAVANHPDFDELVNKTQNNLRVPTLALKNAISSNRKWRDRSFASESSARAKLGQALDINRYPQLHSLRKSLRDEIRVRVETGGDVVLLGGEGHGKSWLAAQICLSYDGIGLFLGAEQLERIGTQPIEEGLISFFIEQTDDIPDESTRLRWSHRFNAWKQQPGIQRFLVIVDGINQRSHLRWDRILNALHFELVALGGRLVVTSRPQFWLRTVSPGLAFSQNPIDIPEWLPEERNQILQHCGVCLDWLDETTLRSLCNPRLLGVSIAVIPHRVADAWKGLTTDRVLMEHLRASQRENFEDETLQELTKRLSNHAKKVLDQVGESAKLLTMSFEEESTAVIETRFFQTLQGPGNAYELRAEGLTLALGYTLVDQLWQAHRRKLDLREHITHLIEPISAIDRTVDVVFAALIVCTLDPIRFDRKIFSALLEAFADLQNVDDCRFKEFVSITSQKPVELMETLGDIVLAGRRRLNEDWLRQAALEIARSAEVWPVVEIFIHRWLRVYNKDAAKQIGDFPKENEEDEKKQILTRKEEIDDILASLSVFELNLLDQMSEVSGDTEAIYSLALSFLAGRPLAGFADSFVALGLGFALGKNIWSARKAFNHLTTFNRVDRIATRDAFRTAVEPLRTLQTSKAGRWTLVRMLYAAGDEASALEASEIAYELRKDQSRWKEPNPSGWRQAQVANPDAARPMDMEKALLKFAAISPAGIMQFMGQTEHDYDLQELLPVVCRFQSDVSVAKIRQILDTLLVRTAIPLRQLILNGFEYSPLATRGVSLDILARAADSDIFSSNMHRERDILRMSLFSYVIQNLSPAEQLECLINPCFGSDYSIRILPFLKEQRPEVISDALQSALFRSDEAVGYGALIAAYYGGTTMTDQLESLIAEFRCAESPSLRSISLQLALKHSLKKLRKAHVESEWYSANIDTRSSEHWYGSLLLVDACANGEISVEEMISRSAPGTWFAAVRQIGHPVGEILAACFLRRLQGALKSPAELAMPAIDITLTVGDGNLSPRYSINSADREKPRFDRELSYKEAFPPDSEADFYERQDDNRTIFETFLRKLEGTDAWMLVERITIDELKLLISHRPSLSLEVVELMEKANDVELAWVKNVAFAAANLVSGDMPERAVALFTRISGTQGFVDFVLEDNLTIAHEAIWSSTPSTAIENLWWRRLAYAASDEILAQEVLAAERFGAEAYIKKFVEENAASPSTLDQAMAVAVAGFSNRSDFYSEIITCHLDKEGISGDAAKMAKSAADAARWARVWLADMWSAKTLEEFWRCLIILGTCMDSRLDSGPNRCSEWSDYHLVFAKLRDNASAKQARKREKTLFGLEAPGKIYLA
ncbi:restriction endonuclease [Massilia timonae]|uniref:Restriction endonuclease family protein n=1 Tax=Massilia timonae TaxID=47229 RepID=A0A1S2N4D7_9BURK|nr:restriction endonuclease [Massilia timonae]OIJ39941.1 restriction endonuclease family protein [Massilia timonae]